jgi:hypothetical protein
MAVAVLIGACGGSEPALPTTATPIAGQTQGWVCAGFMGAYALPLFSANLLIAELKLDGGLERRVTSAQPTDSASLSFLKPLAKGRHVATLTIVNQVRSPFKYNVSGSVGCEAAAQSFSADCEGGFAGVDRTLGSGDAVSCSFTLP